MGARRRRETFEPYEQETTAAIVDHWKLCGVPGSLVASIPNKQAHGQPGLTPGLPDLLVMTPQLGSLTGYIELKRMRLGRLSPAQIKIGGIIQERGAPYAICRGRDEPIAQLRAWGAIR
jgi:VRR-NUC domain-containing protein